MRRKQITHKYSPFLEIPIYEPIRPVGILGELESARQTAEEQAFKRQMEKFFQLFDFYEVDRNSPTCWMKLAWQLALRHVGGMQVLFTEPPKAGRIKTWQAGLGDDLIRAIQPLKDVGDDDRCDAAVEETSGMETLYAR